MIKLAMASHMLVDLVVLSGSYCKDFVGLQGKLQEKLLYITTWETGILINNQISIARFTVILFAELHRPMSISEHAPASTITQETPKQRVLTDTRGLRFIRNKKTLAPTALNEPRIDSWMDSGNN